MFDRFTDNAKRVMMAARTAAQEWGHDYIGTEHLLLGLVKHADFRGATLLAEAGVDLEDVPRRVASLVKKGKGTDLENLPFTPRSKKALEFTMEEAMQLGHNYIGTEHLLIGLIREGKTTAAQVLRQLGVDADDVRSNIGAMSRPPDPAAYAVVCDAVRSLPDELAEALWWFEFRGLTPDEVAKRMGRSIDEVSELLDRARTALRSRWES